MVKHITRTITLLLLMAVGLVVASAIWLHGGARSVAWAKPWLTSALNPPDAPYSIAIGSITVDWRDITKLGSLRFTQVEFRKRDGGLFAVLPEAYATIDPLGFLPQRRVLHKVILNAPQLAMARSASGAITLGVASNASTIPLAALFTSVDAATQPTRMTSSSLPFHAFEIEGATLYFTDVASNTVITSKPFAMTLERHRERYEASLALPFTLDEKSGRIDAFLRANSGEPEQVLNINLDQVPITLLCIFGFCPDNVEGTGMVDGTLGIRIADDGTLNGVLGSVSTKAATFSAPQWFEAPITLGPSQLTAQSDAAAHTITLTSMKLALPDTTITGTGTAHHDDTGWTINANAETGPLDITKVSKYWPITMAPQTRLWVTSKMKSGMAEKGKLRLQLNPQDFAAPYLPDSAVAADVSARGMTFEYLPGFPLIEGMDGEVHFTGTTVKIEGSGGRAMGGTVIRKSSLWCPDLNAPTVPMEATFSLTAPAADAVQILALPQFTFDDAFGLDAAKISGSVTADMALKFDAFSASNTTHSNTLNLDKVTYDITTTLSNVAQDRLMGSYNVRGANGTLAANNAGVDFKGALALGDTGISNVTLSQPSAKPLAVQVKSADGQVDKARNDFSLVYQSTAAGPAIKISGERLDASVAYSTGHNALLANFPAMHLDVNLAELILAKATPLRQVVGKLDCSAARCESAQLRANLEKGTLRAQISRGAAGREFLLRASNAGSFLKALDVTDRMREGTLELRGKYDDSKKNPALNARLLITDFTLKNSQILARIFSIGSLTGLANALTGSGIAFEKLAANITSQAGIITVSKGRANGNAMGITIEGPVDTTADKMNLKGVVVPAFAINSMLGNIPLIGELVGGEGEGLIAFNYAVRGSTTDPDVSVNPLSGLTPGFLRGIFGIFDEDSEPSTAEESVKKSGTEAAPAPPTGLRTPVPNNGRSR